MMPFSFEALTDEYERRVGDLRSLCATAEWPKRKEWLKSTDMLLTRYSVEELTGKLQPYIRPMGGHDVDTIVLVEFSRACGRVKKDFPSRISEYSNVAALYYLWSEMLKSAQPEEASRALWGAIRILMKLLGLLEALEITYIQDGLGKKKMAARVSGGNAKAARYDSVKQEIVRLLNKKGAGKYETKQAAAEDVSEDVWRFCERLTKEINAENQKLPTSRQTRKVPGLIRDHLTQQILNWSRKDVALAEAFNRVVKTKQGSVRRDIDAV